MMAHNANSQQSFYDACNFYLKSLDRELEKDHIDADERDRIRENMMQVVEMISEKYKQNKLFIFGLAVLGTALASGAIYAATSLLGGNVSLPVQSDDDDDEDEEEEDDD